MKANELRIDNLIYQKSKNPQINNWRKDIICITIDDIVFLNSGKSGNKYTPKFLSGIFPQP
jgi:hypothetical protein